MTVSNRRNASLLKSFSIYTFETADLEQLAAFPAKRPLKDLTENETSSHGFVPILDDQDLFVMKGGNFSVFSMLCFLQKTLDSSMVKRVASKIIKKLKADYRRDNSLDDSAPIPLPTMTELRKKSKESAEIEVLKKGNYKYTENNVRIAVLNRAGYGKYLLIEASQENKGVADTAIEYLNAAGVFGIQSLFTQSSYENIAALTEVQRTPELLVDDIDLKDPRDPQLDLQIGLGQFISMRHTEDEASVLFRGRNIGDNELVNAHIKDGKIVRDIAIKIGDYAFQLSGKGYVSQLVFSPQMDVADAESDGPKEAKEERDYLKEGVDAGYALISIAKFVDLLREI